MVIVHCNNDNDNSNNYTQNNDNSYNIIGLKIILMQTLLNNNHSNNVNY